MASADRLIEIFNAAKVRPAGPERDGFLAESCGADAELKQQVLSLLRAHENAGGFLQAGPALSPEIEAELARLKPEEVGERIGAYKLREQIGEGGFGVVWVAEQLEPMRRTVALKIIKLGMDTREVVARFEQERQALAMMDHPNIARVLDAGATEHGRPFFVMELVRGIKITDYCDQANLPTAERLALFIQVCHAVQHAHQKGIIHRDLKPSNILVTLHDGVPVPKVIDFGVAKATQQQRLTDLTVYTQFQQMIGTPLYMSPEQAEMSGLDIDTRSDIYSLGVLLYELLTGGTPFDPKDLMKQGLDEIRRTIREVEPQTPSMFLQKMADETRATVARHRHADPARLTKLVRGDLDWIVMKALEKDRRRRYETAKGLADDIERHLSSEPVLARPVSQFYRFRRLVKRNKLTFAAAGAVSIALSLALLILSVSTMRIVKERNQKNLALWQKGVALEEKGAALADAKVQLFSSLLNQARALRISGQMGQRVGSLQALSEAARIRPDERLRDEAIAAMALSDLRIGPQWDVEERGVSEFRPRTVTDDEGTITIRTLPEPAVIQQIETGRPGGWILMSDDGRFLAQYGGSPGYGLRIWRVADKQSILHAEPVGTRSGTFSSDSRFFAFGQEKQILYFDLTTGEERKLFPLPGPPFSYSFRPDNRQLAVGYLSENVVSIFDTLSGSKYADLPVGDGGSAIVRWHPDGKRIGVGRNIIQLWDVATKRRSETLAGHATGLSDFSFHPDGRIVASMGRGATICRLWELSSGRKLLETLDQEGPFAFSPDGKWLGSIGRGKDRHLLEVELSREYRAIARVAGTDGDLAPDGRLLAMAMRDGVRIWDITNGRELAFLAIGPTQSTFFQPDGRELLTCGDRGLLRWPVRNGENGANQLRLGPPQPIWLPFKPHTASLSKDGRTLAVGREEGPGTLIVDLATGSVTGSVFSTVSQQLELSPNGHLLATVSFRTSQAWLWDVRTGKEVMKWDERWIKRITFTPDGQTILVSHYDAVSFLEAQSFREIRRLPRRSGKDDPGKVVFSQDGKLSAIEVLPGVISLIEVSSGRTVAQLTSPHRYHDRASWMCFDPECTQLIVASQYGIHVWDLRAIRVRLRMMGLDWDWPELPMTTKATESRSPRSPQIESIEVFDRVLPPEPSSLAKMGLLVVQELKGARYLNEANKATFFFAAVKQLEAYYRTQGRFAEAVPLLAEMSACAPQNTKLAERVCALQAWLGQDAGHGATCRRVLGSAVGTDDPDIADRAAKGYCLRPSSDPQLMKNALTLAAHAVELGKQNPNLHDHQLALGLAQYRHGDYTASEKTLRSAERTGPDKENVNQLARFFRAMSLFRQGKRAEAHKLFTETVKVMTPLPADERDVLSERTITSQIIIWLAYKEAKVLLELATKL